MRTPLSQALGRIGLGAALVAAATLVPGPAQAAVVTYENTTAVGIPNGEDTSCAGTTGHGSVTSTITVPDTFEVQDLDVDLDITHTWVGDLIVELTSPAGTTITLVDRIGRPLVSCGLSADDLDTVLDDDAAASIEAYLPGDPVHAPMEPLSTFEGEDPAGTWTLTVYDAVSLDAGTLESWALIFDSGPGLLAVGDATAGEGDAEATFTVTRTGSLLGTDSVDYATVDGTATAGDDYTATTGTLTFDPGVETLEVTVPILDDTLVEGDETFTLELSNPVGEPAATIERATGTGTIVDDDEEAPPTTPTTTPTTAPSTTTTSTTVPPAPRSLAVVAQPTYAG